MKKICLTVLALTTVLSFAGCKDTQTPQETTPPVSEPTVTVAPTEPTVNPDVIPVYENMYSVALPVTVEEFHSEDNTLICTYAYQTISPILQDREVADKIITDFTDRVEKTRVSSQEIVNLANSQYTPGSDFTPLSYEIQYDVKRLDQGVLSFFGHIIQTSTASGANHSLIAANYDLVTGDILTVGSILYHIDTKDDLAQLVVDQLKERDDIILFDEYEDTVKARFEQDESTDEDFYFSDAGLCFYFAPYEIAPRSSGTVIVEIPYNKLTGIIADAYFPAERTHTVGTITCEAFQETHWDEYEQFTDVVAKADSTKLLLTTDSAVQDIRIYELVLPNDKLMQTQYKNIFATNFLSGENGIILEADFNENTPNYMICYSVNGVTQSFCFTVDAATGNISLVAQ